MNNQLAIRMATNMGSTIGTLELQLSQYQLQNEQLKRQNAELQTQINNLRKEGEKSEPRRYNSHNQQNNNQGKQQPAHH